MARMLQVTDIETVQEGLIKNLPEGLERALLVVLRFHVGEKHAIGRGELMAALRSHGFDLREDRPVRALINELRKGGELICSKGGPGGGYWLPATREEAEEWLAREVHPRAMDLLEVEQAQRRAILSRWGEGKQGRLL